MYKQPCTCGIVVIEVKRVFSGVSREKEELKEKRRKRQERFQEQKVGSTASTDFNLSLSSLQYVSL